MYSAADIQLMGQAATAHKLYHTTYYNHLAAWVCRCETEEAVAAVTYGAALPEGLAANMAAILVAANAQSGFEHAALGLDRDGVFFLEVT